MDTAHIEIAHKALKLGRTEYWSGLAQWDIPYTHYAVASVIAFRGRGKWMVHYAGTVHKKEGNRTDKIPPTTVDFNNEAAFNTWLAEHGIHPWRLEGDDRWKKLAPMLEEIDEIVARHDKPTA